MHKSILIADDESAIRESLAETLREAGYNVLTACDGLEAAKVLGERNLDVALVDYRMPGMDGLEVLAKAREMGRRTQIVVMTAFGTVENAVEAVKLGASDYVTKPFVFDDILIKIERLLDMRDLADDNLLLRHELETRYRFNGIVGSSQALQGVLDIVQKLAHTRSSALITGESGTGKELVARAIHQNGITQKGRFVAINCGALPEALVESELFGHKRGAFTGATQDKPGLFTMADEGTIFLDEVCSMPLAVQAKLLRVLEEKQITPVGSTEPVCVNVRILCATNRDLAEEVQNGRFREDLYYRLNVVEVYVPPLRERREDIPDLVGHFVAMFNRELNRNCPGVTDQAMEAMLGYSWPGNVRELANVIERGAIFAVDRPISMDELAFATRQVEIPQQQQSDLKSALRSFERQHILRVLRRHNFNKNATAGVLNVGVSSLYRKIDQLGIGKHAGRYEEVDGGVPIEKQPIPTDDGGNLLRTN